MRSGKRRLMGRAALARGSDNILATPPAPLLIAQKLFSAKVSAMRGQGKDD